MFGTLPIVSIDASSFKSSLFSSSEFEILELVQSKSETSSLSFSSSLYVAVKYLLIMPHKATSLSHITLFINFYCFINML
jgi:hypothetical protein